MDRYDRRIERLMAQDEFLARVVRLRTYLEGWRTFATESLPCVIAIETEIREGYASLKEYFKACDSGAMRVRTTRRRTKKRTSDDS